MIVRPAHGGDVQRLAEFPLTPRAVGWVASGERWLSGQAWAWSRSDPDRLLLVAIERDVLLGAAGLEPWTQGLTSGEDGPRVDPAPGDTAFSDPPSDFGSEGSLWTLRGFVVARGARHSGVGTRLLADCGQYGREHGARSIFWRAHSDHVIAHELAMKSGAAIVGTVGSDVVFALSLR